ncbi:MAG TPA: hypothetical protein PLD23_05760 [Armatimonadota bacterium]|nr:hypothetical protein [Armatimonadota bacterium]
MTVKAMRLLLVAGMAVGVWATSTPARADGFEFSITAGDRHDDEFFGLHIGWYDDDRDDPHHRYWGDFEPCKRCRDRDMRDWCDKCRNRYNNRFYDDLCDRCRDRDRDHWCDKCRHRYDLRDRDDWDRDRYQDRYDGGRVSFPPGVYGGPHGLYAEPYPYEALRVVPAPDRRGYTTTIFGDRRSPFVGRPNWRDEQWRTNDWAPPAPRTTIVLPSDALDGGRRRDVRRP